ncbi:3-ketoacyl-CoA thiolase [Rubripirellula obstinata]|uniref:3-ketoacyl-CoA thiolase n=1 Tax=Rubripirellula obstinata TaxID=406547 RepID=A0A5B1CP76_9BACT|nr:thiolase family protein [Rubripirellula obstinata]KAA1261410.1 3-ketoacyl-CoA thiolase [Rubripirellula obstinata]
MSDRIAIIDGIRTPFAKAGTDLAAMKAQKLASIVIRELLDRTAIDPELVDEVIVGCVANPMDAANVGRVAALMAGLPQRSRGYTVSRNCAAGFESVTSGYEKLFCGAAEVVIAGGTESMSNIPLIYNKHMTGLLTDLMRSKSAIAKLKTLASFRPHFLKPVIGVVCGLTDPVCGLSMGQTAENIAMRYGITRDEQDEFALSSHKKAVAARDKLAEEIVAVPVGPDYKSVCEEDNGPRPEQTLKALGKLKPYFDRQSGTVTVGNACPITDGASAMLMMKESKADALGLTPLGFIKSYAYEGLDPAVMGLGPVHAISTALNKAAMELDQMSFVEINEAFAAQVIGCVKLIQCDDFAKKHLGRDQAIGQLEPARLNVNGGAIALGHPVGVTGNRLILTALRELKRRGDDHAIVSLCVGGGQGGAVILERAKL